MPEANIHELSSSLLQGHNQVPAHGRVIHAPQSGLAGHEPISQIAAEGLLRVRDSCRVKLSRL